MVLILVPVLLSKSEADATASLSGPRPAANYTFGDSGGLTYNSESSSKQMRKILRSPSAEREPAGAKGVAPQTSFPPNGGASKCEVIIRGYASCEHRGGKIIRNHEPSRSNERGQ